MQAMDLEEHVITGGGSTGRHAHSRGPTTQDEHRAVLPPMKEIAGIRPELNSQHRTMPYAMLAAS